MAQSLTGPRLKNPPYQVVPKNIPCERGDSRSAFSIYINGWKKLTSRGWHKRLEPVDQSAKRLKTHVKRPGIHLILPLYYVVAQCLPRWLEEGLGRVVIRIVATGSRPVRSFRRSLNCHPSAVQKQRHWRLRERGSKSSLFQVSSALRLCVRASHKLG